MIALTFIYLSCMHSLFVMDHFGFHCVGHMHIYPLNIIIVEVQSAPRPLHMQTVTLDIWDVSSEPQSSPSPSPSSTQ